MTTLLLLLMMTMMMTEMMKTVATVTTTNIAVATTELNKDESMYRCNMVAVVKCYLGCLHAVARVISYDVGFNPSTQRHNLRLIYYLYIRSYMFRSYDHHPKIVQLGYLEVTVQEKLRSGWPGPFVKVEGCCD
jgi:hypothetical protein